MYFPEERHASAAVPAPHGPHLSQMPDPAPAPHHRRQHPTSPADAWQDVADEFLRRSAERGPLLRSRSASPQRLHPPPELLQRQHPAMQRRRRPTLRDEAPIPLTQNAPPHGFDEHVWREEQLSRQKAGRRTSASGAAAKARIRPRVDVSFGVGHDGPDLRNVELYRERRGRVQRWLHSTSGTDSGSGGDRIPAAWTLPGAQRSRRPERDEIHDAVEQRAGRSDRRHEVIYRSVSPIRGGRPSPRHGLGSRDVGSSLSPARHRSVSPGAAMRGPRDGSRARAGRERVRSASLPSARSAGRQPSRRSAVPGSAEAAARQLRASYAEWQAATRRLIAVGHRATRHRRWKTCCRAFQVRSCPSLDISHLWMLTDRGRMCRQPAVNLFHVSSKSDSM